MTTTIETPAKTNGKTMAGIIILVIGGLLLIDQTNLLHVPDWLFSWPMWLIGYGLYMGGKYNFKKPIWVIMILLGGAFLITENINNADDFVWPAAIIATGAWMVMKHTKKPVAETTDTHYTQV